MSEGHFVKVRLPDKKEARIINVSGFSESGFSELRQKTKDKFNLSDDDFYYLYKDPTEDMVSIRTADDYMVLYNFCTAALGKNRIGFQFTLVLPSEQKEALPVVSSAAAQLEDGFINLFQAVINNIETGISNFQNTVEQNTTTAAEKLAQVAAEAATNICRATTTQQKMEEENVVCDICTNTIKDKSWRCLTCDNINLCSSCKSDSKHDPNHIFRCVKSEKSKEKEPLQKVNHIAAICDYCNSLIEGTRHKCTVCPDFDFCHTCYVIAKDSHFDHPFQTILAGGDKKVASTKKKGYKRKSTQKKSKSYPVHFGVHCDNCQSIVKGIRYKCGHCEDFDLCETCEKLSCHNESHVFLKIKNPIQCLPMTVLLPNFTDLQMKSEVETRSTGASSRTKKYEAPTTPLQQQRNVQKDVSEGLQTVPSSEVPTRVVPEVKNHESMSIDPKPTLSASFIVDINIPDGTVVAPKSTFIKMWKLKNTGSEPWPIGSQLVYHSGDILRSYPSTHPYGFAVPSVKPNDDACVVAELEAPENPGEYTSYFSVTSPEGTRFGDVLWCTIKVKESYPVEEKPGECSMIYPVLMHDSSSDIHQVPNEMTETSTHHDDETFSLASSDLIQVQEANPFEENASTSSLSRSVKTSSSRNSASSSRSGRSQRTGSYSSTDDFIMVADSDKEEGEVEEREEEYHDLDDKSVSTRHSSTAVLTEEKQPSFTSSPSARSIGSNTESVVYEDANLQSYHSEVSNENTGGVYQSQLLQIHEMGFTHCDELTIHLLRMYDGAVDKVVPKLLETLYP